MICTRNREVFLPPGAQVSKLAGKVMSESFSLREKVARAKREPGRASIKNAKREPGRASIKKRTG